MSATAPLHRAPARPMSSNEASSEPRPVSPVDDAIERLRATCERIREAYKEGPPWMKAD